MSEIKNGARANAWDYFIELVKHAFIIRGLGSEAEAVDLAYSLDMSFDELYENVPRTEWARHVAKDADDYAREIKGALH